MSDTSETFFTTVGCMDGRVQEPVAEFGRRMFDAKFSDTITEAGLVGLLGENPKQSLLDSIKQKLNISIEKHHSKGILIHGHEECAASNAVSDELHIEDVKKSVEKIKELTNGKVSVIGLFVKRSSSDPKIWEALEV